MPDTPETLYQSDKIKVIHRPFDHGGNDEREDIRIELADGTVITVSHGSGYESDYSVIVNEPTSQLDRNEEWEPDLDICPNCEGPADNGHDRCVPPSPYYCSKCEAEGSA